MRSAVIVSAVIIALAIDPVATREMIDSLRGLDIIILVIYFVMDAYELIERMKSE